MDAHELRQKDVIEALGRFHQGDEKFRISNLIGKLPKKVHNQATSDKVLNFYFERLNRLGDTSRLNFRRAKATSKRMLLDEIQKGLAKNDKFWRSDKHEQIWRKVLFDAVYAVESHLVNLKFGSSKDLQWAYAMGKHAYDNGGRCFLTTTTTF
ncbi:hypothetical protein ACQY0O_007881 [Thecaphora frezii]